MNSMPHTTDLSYYRIPVTDFQQYCTLLVCTSTQEAALIDPGAYTIELERLLHSPLQLTTVLLTHGHLDHVGAADAIARRYKVPICGPHLEEKTLLANLPLQSKYLGLPCRGLFFPDQWLQDQEIIQVGKLQIRAHHTPGHTPGHLVFSLAQEALLWTGDLLFHGSIGRSDLPGGDEQQLQRSLRWLMSCFPAHTHILPGHGPISTLEEEQRHNPFLLRMFKQTDT